MTAAAQGIGRASALAYAAEGAEVLATDINRDALALLDGTAGITTCHLDVTSPDSIAAVAAEYGAPDILFNVAGVVPHGTIQECGEPEWDAAFEINVKAAYRMIRAFLPSMLENGGGSIINMSSVCSSLKGLPKPVRLRRNQSSRYRNDQIRCRWTTFATAFDAMRSVREPSRHRHWTNASMRLTTRIPHERISSDASHWDGLERPRKLPRWLSILPATNPGIQPAPR